MDFFFGGGQFTTSVKDLRHARSVIGAKISRNHLLDAKKLPK